MHRNMNHNYTKACKIGISLSIIFCLFVMRATVNFYHNVTVDTKKVNDKVSNNFLAVKIIAFKLSFMELLPK